MKRSKTQLLRSLAAVMLLGAGLASCSQDDFADKQQGAPLPLGEYPLILNAGGLEAIATPVQQSAPSTRGTMDGNWGGVESVAVMVNGDVKEYKVTTLDAEMKTARLEVIDGGTPFYWQNTADLTVKAWYPYKQIEEKIDLPTTWNEDDFATHDWLGAEKTMQFRDNTSHTLQFNHLLSKITVNLKESDYLSAYGQEKVTVTCSLSSNSFTFKGVQWNEADNVVEFDSEASTSTLPTDVTPMRLDASANGAFASFMCLANPDMESIDITVTVDGTEYKATELKPQEPFKPGHTYTFDITVKAEGLEVSVNDDIAWNDDGAAGSGSVDLDIVLDDDSNREFQLADGDEITVRGIGSPSKGKLTFKIPTGSTAKVNLQEINIQTYREYGGEKPLQNFIKIEGGGKVIFNLIGTNTIKLAGAMQSYDRNPGAICTDGSEIMITGDGTLKIIGEGDGGIVSKNGGNITIWETNIYMDYTGCYTSKGACIGSYERDNCGNIVIYKSDVEIKFISKIGFNNNYSPAIGPSYAGTCGNVTITLKDGQNSKSDFLKKITLTDQNGNSAQDDHKVVYAPRITDNQHGTLTWLDSAGKPITN